MAVFLDLENIALGALDAKQEARQLRPARADEASESNSTPVPNTDQPTTDETPKKISTKGPKPGSKRGLGLGSDSMPKPRGKPGPKKKPRL